MAIAGGATTAYRCRLEDGALVAVATSTLRSLCVAVDDAVPQLREGWPVLVAGSDMVTLRRLLADDKKIDLHP